VLFYQSDRVDKHKCHAATLPLAYFLSRLRASSNEQKGSLETQAEQTNFPTARAAHSFTVDSLIKRPFQ
jgi:hypothetical protein